MTKYFNMNYTCITIIALFFFVASCTTNSSSNSFSPDGNISVITLLNENGKLEFTVKLKDEIIIHNSALGIVLDEEGCDFTSGLKQTNFRLKEIDEEYTMFVGKRTQRRNHCTEAVYSFQNEYGKNMDVVFRIFDDAVAYSYKVYNTGKTSVEKEFSTFNFSNIANTWSIPYSSGDERFFTKRTTGAELEKNSLSFPVLIETESTQWALISESNVSNYPLSSGQFSGKQINYVFSTEHIAENTVEANFVSPWRVMILGENLGAVVESCVIDHLAPPTQMTDLSWIEPGVTSFPWWGDNLANSYPEALKKYYDLSAALGWKYVEFDVPLIGSPGKAVDDWKTTDWIKSVVDYGIEKGVLTYGWDDLKNVNTPEKRKDIFSKYNKFGIRGIKVDFVNSYSQRTRKVVEELIQDAANYKLMLSFHGAQSPRGFARTYPHIMTFEAVKGSEYYLSINGAQGMKANHNCTLPFTRNVLGSMDYTPVAFSTDLRVTTMAHELALSIIFESGWQGICDVPEAYLNSVAKPFLEQLYATWDETKFLDGYPGEYCCMARRKGNKWFVAGINSADARTVAILLPFANNTEVDVYTDLSDELNNLGIVNKQLSADKPFKIEMKKNGGFAFVVEL